MYSLTSAWMNDCVNKAGDLRRHRAHHDVTVIMSAVISRHDDVIKWKHFPRYWPFVRGIPRSPVNSPHKGQWRGALMFSLIYVWLNGWVNNRKAGDLRRRRVHYDVAVMGTNLIVKGRFYLGTPKQSKLDVQNFWSIKPLSDYMVINKMSRTHNKLILKSYTAAISLCQQRSYHCLH